MKLDNYSDSATFLSEFEKAVNELKSAGAQINEKEKLNYMLNTLPNSYSYIGDLIDALKPEDQTVAYVKNKIEIAEKKQQDEHGERKTNAFAAKKEGCYTCGGMHFARDCTKNKGEYSAWRGSSRGRGYCRGSGNYSRNSGSRVNGGFRGANGGYSGRGYNARSRGNFRGQRGRAAAAATHEQREVGANVWVATAHAVCSSELNKLSKCEINWLLDSGCMDHVINNDKYFDNFIELKEPVNNYLGDNRSIKATKIGNVISYFEAFEKLNEVNINNVFFQKI